MIGVIVIDDLGCVPDENAACEVPQKIEIFFHSDGQLSKHSSGRALRARPACVTARAGESLVLRVTEGRKSVTGGNVTERENLFCP